MNTSTRNVPLVLLWGAVLLLLAGCGGGGGGGGSASGPSTVTITGQVKDTGTGTPLASRTVTVQGTGLKTMTGTDGMFSIGGVTVGTVTLVVTDSNNTVNGSSTVDLSKLSGNPRSVGTLSYAVTTGTGPGNGPPAPPLPGG